MNRNIDGVSGRIILIDNNPAIHQDFRRIFGSGLRSAAALSASEADLVRRDEDGHDSVRTFRSTSHCRANKVSSSSAALWRRNAPLRGGVRRCANANRLGRNRDHHATAARRPRPAGRHVHRAFRLLIGAVPKETRARGSIHRFEEAI